MTTIFLHLSSQCATLEFRTKHVGYECGKLLLRFVCVWQSSVMGFVHENSVKNIWNCWICLLWYNNRHQPTPRRWKNANDFFVFCFIFSFIYPTIRSLSCLTILDLTFFTPNELPFLRSFLDYDDDISIPSRMRKRRQTKKKWTILLLIHSSSSVLTFRVARAKWLELTINIHELVVWINIMVIKL